MHLEKYQYQEYKTHLDYQFYSQGPKGRIKKVVRFQPDLLNGIPYYNLLFGDFKDGEQDIDDRVRTNNADAEKVLATVAAILVDFLDRYPHALVYAQGSTPSRTRRYRMGITRLWTEIEPVFEIYGLNSDGTLEICQKNVTYEAFLIKHR
jgi:hypothetical protein